MRCKDRSQVRGYPPSIVPNVDDHSVYLVVDDFAATEGPTGKPMSKPPIWKR